MEMKEDVKRELIAQYKEYLGQTQNQAENYKWDAIDHFQKTWDIDASDFESMFLDAFKLQKNLLFMLSWSFIRKAVHWFPDEVRGMFKGLYDEQTPLKDRVQAFQAATDEILPKVRERASGTIKGTAQDERTISVYLTFRYPERYFLYKESFYKAYCGLIGESPRPAGEKLLHYIELANDLKEAVKTDLELLDMHRGLHPDLTWDETNLIVQNILYVLLEQGGKTDAKRNPDQELIDAFKKINAPAALRSFFGYLHDAFMKLGVPKGDPRVEFTCTDKNLNVHIDHRFVYTLARAGRSLRNMVIIPPDRLDQWKTSEFYEKHGAFNAETDEEQPALLYLKGRPEQFPFVNLAELKAGIAYQWKLTPREFRDTAYPTNQVFEKCVFDPAMLEEVMKKAFGSPKPSPYTKEDLLSEVFITEESLTRAEHLLKRKKNIILQGPPGTGKTFLARRLAWLLKGRRSDAGVRMVQFHQSYAYEDFIQGYRPENGQLVLKNGLFYEMVTEAMAAPYKVFVMIIDEINRGNLSKIFGELMFLLETDKRGEKVRLAYSGEDFTVPENVYIIGTMNTADRSLAMVDYALRRRFAFITMEPNFGERFQAHLAGLGFKEDFIEDLTKRVNKVNQMITDDPSLRKDFQVGHSYFLPQEAPHDPKSWLNEVLEYEIVPLLEEYWFDNDNQVQRAKEALGLKA